MKKNIFSIYLLFATILTFGQGTATYFDGNDNVIDCSASAVVLPGTFTQEMWIYIDGNQTGWKGLIGDGTNGNALRPPSLYTYNTTGVHFGFGDGTEWLSTTISTNLLIQDEWNHYAVTFDGQDYRLFINGSEIIFDGSFAAGKTPYGAPQRYIGWSNATNHFTGKIDEVRLWNTARTLDEIREFMSREIPNPNSQTGLVSYYKMNDGSGLIATNEITGASDGTLSGMTNSDWQDSEAFNTWLGTTNDWNTSTNWSRGIVPLIDDNVGIYDGPVFDPTISNYEAYANSVIKGIATTLSIDFSSFLSTNSYYSSTTTEITVDGELYVLDTIEIAGNIDGKGMVYAGYYKLREDISKSSRKSPNANVTVYGLSPTAGMRAAGGTWLGTGSTNDWFDGNNWNKGVPDDKTSVLIDEDYSPPLWPEVNSSGSTAECKNLYLDGSNALLMIGTDGLLNITKPGGSKKNLITIVDGEIDNDGGDVTTNTDVVIDNGTLTIGNSGTMECDGDVDVKSGSELNLENSASLTIGQ